MVRGRNDAEIFRDISHNRLPNGHIMIHFGLYFRPETSRRPTRTFPAQQQAYLFTAHEYLRWKPSRIKRAFELYYKHGQYKNMDFTARLIPQFARYVKEQLEKNDPNEVLHWNEVTRQDPTMMQDLCNLEHVGLPQTDEQRESQLQVWLQREQQQLPPGASGQHVFRAAHSPGQTEPSVGAYSLRANAFAEYRAKSLEESKTPEGLHPPSSGLQHHTTELDDEYEDDENEDEEEEEHDEEEVDYEVDYEEEMELGRSHRKPVPDHHRRKLAEWKEGMDDFNERLSSEQRMEWFEHVLRMEGYL